MIMKDVAENFHGKNLYILSRYGYPFLRNIVSILRIMRNAALPSRYYARKLFFSISSRHGRRSVVELVVFYILYIYSSLYN